MFERGFPRFDGVRGKKGVPVEAIDGEAAMIDGRQDLSDADAFDVSLRAEIKTRQSHGDVAFDGAVEGKVEPADKPDK